MPALLWSQRYQLNSPKILADSVFFRQKVRVQLEFDLDSAVISYTADGKIPGKNAPVYKTPFTVDSSAVIRAKSDHPQFLTSSMAEKHLYKVSAVPDSFRLLTMPDTAYKGNGAASLFDLQKAGRDLHDGRWLGFRTDSVVVTLQFGQATASRVMLLSTLFDPGAWIFPPRSVEVYGQSGDRPWMPMGRWMAKTDTLWKERPVKYDDYLRVVMRPVKVDRLRIRIIPYGPMPDGHPRAGTRAWLFIDEIAFQY
ncbi:MAG: chitobiase/beta-hexosaminidase C-terminal domain-containing protein [Thermoanaerobaculia bacterium]|nr:chitobiase/beta-hexosaminidase C-terminal domain-containing protein [Thermoanaerobaculia bacterium]